ncbi:MAG TPA: glutamyl-tRNA reductase, partial [Dehalococcoidia bacterium]|nr:glutamyl-tRNA reductase [Dehalococcoidia bacterium]
EKEQLGPSLGLLSQYVQQGVLLSTCNRLEVYTYNDEDTGLVDRLAQFLADCSGVPGSHLTPHLYQHRDQNCARHLFRVASGLDSMVVGEHQVLGQVRTAFSVASEEGYVRGPLSRLFHQALRVARYIHRDTSIGNHARSVSRAGVQLARGLLVDLSQQRVLVIGAGDAGRLVAQVLADAGVRQIVVTNRTHWRAEDLARELGGVAAPFDELTQQLNRADVVISSTGSPGYVLDRTTVQDAVQQRQGRPLLLIDIAVPRDIDPSVADLDGVRLYDIDALQSLSEADAASLEKDIAWAEGIVDQETLKFQEWWSSLDVVTLIASVRERAEVIRRAEVAKTLSRLKGQYSDGPEELESYLDAMTTALVKKLLHHPTVALKETRDPAQQQLVRQLFNLDGGLRRRGRK